MKLYLVIAVSFVVLAAAASVEAEDSEYAESSPHVVEKRQITVKPPFPRCVFYECIASCKQRGYKSGGYCTIRGCQCLR